MQEKIKELEEEAAKIGLKINANKTKCLKVNTKSNTPLQLQSSTIEDVPQFNYLGSIVANDGGTKQDIEHRLSKARSTFNRLWHVWRSPYLARSTKVKIFNACVKSTLLYGCETWHIDASYINKIQVYINKCLRIICKVFWPIIITNEELWAITEQKPICTTIKERKWRWLGHTLQKTNNTISKQALEWNPQGKRRVGRPRNTWRRTILKEVESSGKTWSEVKYLAQNRVRFRGYVEALCSQRE
ncbi:uncharacterized protein LOC129616286 [Condylostylus longicornis]|uniref:uncharacterized protein LOC129616286 n=1 Tax=Condylostylus longicornis TaxID=2530218 RepID=UPI00244E0685|nr:uncharacterized protein LOC129616286 [Condylostylus longicornis]